MMSNLSRSEIRREPWASTLGERLAERRRFIQVVAGPRQVGKTTLVGQVVGAAALPAVVVSADQPSLRDAAWLAAQWERARILAAEADADGAILVVDEVQKVTGWSEAVKQLWDEDTRARLPLKVVLLGSAPLLVQRGLTESLAGRFEIIRLPHWSFAEMRAAFGFSLDQYLHFGGYPGAATLVDDAERWRMHVLDSLVETTIARDVLLLTRVDKPALLRRLFELGCRHSGQIVSYTKLLGQLHDAGNTTTLAHYLELLSGAGMLTGLPKYAGNAVRQRASSPKLQVLNTALMSAMSGLSFAEARADREYWGRLVETAVGAHLANAAALRGWEVFYWRERNREVDFVVRAGSALVAFEVKSSRGAGSLSGLAAFAAAFRPTRTLLVGGDGIPVEDFLAKPAETWIVGVKGRGTGAGD